MLEGLRLLQSLGDTLQSGSTSEESPTSDGASLLDQTSDGIFYVSQSRGTDVLGGQVVTTQEDLALRRQQPDQSYLVAHPVAAGHVSGQVGGCLQVTLARRGGLAQDQLLGR